MTAHKNRPMISVGMPVFNGGKDLANALDSLLEEDVPGMEIIISDNASTDETQDVCEEYQRNYPIIRYYRSDINRGSLWNFNHVLDLASGKYFMWASHDDIRDKTFIPKCLNVLEKNLDAALCQTHACGCLDTIDNVIHVNTHKCVSGIYDPVKRFKNAFRYMPATVFYGVYRREKLEKIRPIENCISADVVFTTRLMLYGGVVEVPEKLFYYFGRKNQRTVEQDYKLINERKKPFWYFAFWILDLQHSRGVWRSPLNLHQKLNLQCFIIRTEIKQIFVKLVYRVLNKILVDRLPDSFTQLMGNAIFYSPDVNIIGDTDKLPRHVTFKGRLLG